MPQTKRLCGGQNVECKYGTKKRFPFLSQGAFVLTLAIRPPQQHVIALSSQSRRTQQNIGHPFPGGPQALQGPRALRTMNLIQTTTLKFKLRMHLNAAKEPWFPKPRQLFATMNGHVHC